MKTLCWYVLAASMLMLMVRCSSDENLNEGGGDEAVATEIGAPIGPVVTENIGASGGVITSGDGRLTITVPPGAVAVNTIFSIEPVEDFCPGGMGSYRLLPEGTTFSEPVKITFHYNDDDLEGTLSEFLDIAYQGTDNKWYALSWVILDEQSNHISVDVRHFTNWALASKLRIEPRNPLIPVVEKGATYNLHLAGAKDSPPRVIPAGPGEVDDLPELPRKKPAPFTATWFVNGVTNGNSNVGTISVDSKTHVTYHAPNHVPANNPVLVAAELTDYEFWDRNKKEITKLSKVVCLKRIKIKPDEYNFTFEFDFHFNNACGLPNVLYRDGLSMDVQVKEVDNRYVVNFYNILNEDATTNPSQRTQDECTDYCLTGGAGLLNVNQATGRVSLDPDQLEITISNANTSPTLFKTVCSNGSEASATIPLPTPPGTWTFDLSEEKEQTITTDFFTIKLSPK